MEDGSQNQEQHPATHRRSYSSRSGYDISNIPREIRPARQRRAQRTSLSPNSKTNSANNNDNDYSSNQSIFIPPGLPSAQTPRQALPQRPSNPTTQPSQPSQCTRVSPGYTRLPGEYRLYNPQTGRGWLRTTQAAIHEATHHEEMTAIAAATGPLVTPNARVNIGTDVVPRNSHHPEPRSRRGHVGGIRKSARDSTNAARHTTQRSPTTRKIPVLPDPNPTPQGFTKTPATGAVGVVPGIVSTSSEQGPRRMREPDQDLEREQGQRNRLEPTNPEFLQIVPRPNRWIP